MNSHFMTNKKLSKSQNHKNRILLLVLLLVIALIYAITVMRMGAAIAVT